MNAAENDSKAQTLRKLRLAKRDFPLREIVITVLLIVCLWVTDIFVLRRAYDRKYFLVVGQARQTLSHCRDMVVNRVRKDVYRVVTCKKAYFYKVAGDRVTLVKVTPFWEQQTWAN